MAFLPFIRRGLAARKSTRRTVFAGPSDKPLDLLMPPPYELSEQRQQADQAQVERRVEALKPNAVDAGSREVLFNLVNALAEKSLAELDAARDERQAIARFLIGLAAEELTRHKPRYDIDSARANQAAATLALTYEELTGRKATEHLPVGPVRTSRERLESGVGAINLHLDDPPRLPYEPVELYLEQPTAALERGEQRDDHH